MEAVGNRGTGRLQRLRQIEKPRHGDVLPQLGQGLALIDAGQQVGPVLPGGLENHHVAREVAQLAEQRREVLAPAV